MTAETQGRLIYMVNQIGRNLAAQGQDKAIAGTADHIAKFWDPGMRAQILALSVEYPERFEPIAAAAVAQLRG